MLFLLIVGFLLPRFLLLFLIELAVVAFLRDLVQAKRRKLRKAAEVRRAATAAAGETSGPQVSVTTEGPAGRSVEEDTRPVEGGSTGQERKEEEATTSSPPAAGPREERQATRLPTPLR